MGIGLTTEAPHDIITCILNLGPAIVSMLAFGFVCCSVLGLFRRSSQASSFIACFGLNDFLRLCSGFGLACVSRPDRP